MKWAALIASSTVVILCVAFVAALTLYPPFLLWWELIGLNVTAPERDAKIALARGRPVCYSINAYASYFPGVEGDENIRFCEANGKNFVGTSDLIVSEWHSRLMREAENYATVFNSHIIQHRPSNQ